MKHRFPVLLVLLTLMASITPIALAQSDALPRPVSAALKTAGIPPGSISLWVQESGARQPRWQHNADMPMNPASTMKVLTTFAGLEILSPAYTWKTELLSGAAVRDGVLQGDLYLRGSGDPRLTFEQFWLLLRQLKQQGIKEIRGDLVLDRSVFAPSNNGTPFDDQPMRPYNVKPDGLLLNWKSVRLQLNPVEQKLDIRMEPYPANLYVVSQVALVEGECGEWRDRLRSDLSEREGYANLVITGQYPRSCGEQRWNLGVLTHPQYVFGVFRQLWEELGGSISGNWREGKVPETANRLGQIESAPLAEIIRDINKFSNNVMARQLYLSLGDGTLPGAENSVRTWLKQRGLNLPGLVLENGSGLSRQERISAAGMANLLEAIWASPNMPEMLASLPITGVDGTLRKRLRDTPAAGQGHLKTGTLEGVKTIAGYVRDKRGRWQTVVLFINHPNAGQAVQDAFLLWLASQ